MLCLQDLGRAIASCRKEMAACIDQLVQTSARKAPRSSSRLSCTLYARQVVEMQAETEPSNQAAALDQPAACTPLKQLDFGSQVVSASPTGTNDLIAPSTGGSTPFKSPEPDMQPATSTNQPSHNKENEFLS